MNQNNDDAPPGNTSPDPGSTIEKLLREQTQTLDQIFHQYLAHAEIGRFSEDRIHVALRAQAQCQATTRALRQWRQQSDRQQTGQKDTP